MHLCRANTKIDVCPYRCDPFYTAISRLTQLTGGGACIFMFEKGQSDRPQTRMRQDPRAPHPHAGKSTSQRRRLATQSTNLHSPCFSRASVVSFSCARSPVVSPARQFLSALRRSGHLLSCRAWCCTVSCASHCCCSAVLLGCATSHSMGAHPLSASPRALGPPSTGVGGPRLLLGLLACWALALLSALAARSVWSAALGPPSSGVGGPCSQLGLSCVLGPRVVTRACCPRRRVRRCAALHSALWR